MALIKLIDSLTKLVSKENLTREDLELMFVKIRLILEKINIKDQYTHLNFYCDWIVHTEINRPNKVIDLILILNKKVLINYDEKKPMNIVSLFEPEGLKYELNKFFKNVLKLENHITTDVFWLLFYNLCHILSNRPLRIPENPPKKYLEKIEKIKNYKKFNEEFFGLSSIELEINEGQIEGFSTGTVMWKAEDIYSSTTIIGKLF